MATREEVMATADRLIRRGELGEALGLLEIWTKANPGDAGAASKLASVRELADPAELRARALRPVAGQATQPKSEPKAEHKPLPADPIEALKELLERVQANRRK